MKMFHDKQGGRKETFTVTLHFPTWYIVHVLTLHRKQQKKKGTGGHFGYGEELFPSLF